MRIVTFLAISCLALGCSSLGTESTAVCDGATRVRLSWCPMPYSDAAAYCESIGGSLVEFNSTVEVQTVYDAWIDAERDGTIQGGVDGLWVGTWLTADHGAEYGYAMIRGGALVPVEMDGERTAVAACEVPY